MNKKILAILTLLVIVIGVAIAMYSKSMTSENTMNTSTQAVNSSTSSESYIPTPIDRTKLLSGKFTENQSADGKFISHGFDNEQGDSGIYITSSDGTEVTATYCGFFKDWSPDSKKITVFVPYECGKNVSENETFELHVDGTISR